MTLRYGQARCSCGKVYPAARGCSDGRQIICPSCANARATQNNLTASRLNLRAASRATQPRRRGLFG